MRFSIVILLVTVTSGQNQSPVRHRRLFVTPVERYLRVNGRPEQQQQAFGSFDYVGFNGPQSNPNFQDYRQGTVDGYAGNFRENFNQRKYAPDQQAAGRGQDYHINEAASRRNFNINNGEQYYGSEVGVIGINQQEFTKSKPKYIEMSEIAQIQAQVQRDNQNRHAHSNSDSQNSNKQYYSNEDTQKDFERRQDSVRTTPSYLDISQNQGSSLQYENRNTNIYSGNDGQYPTQENPNYNVQGRQNTGRRHHHRTEYHRTIQPSYNEPTSTEDFLFRSGDSISQHQYNSNSENRRENDNIKNNQRSRGETVRHENNERFPSNENTFIHHSSNTPNLIEEVSTSSVVQTGTSYEPDVGYVNEYTNKNSNDQRQHSTNDQRHKQTTTSRQREHSVDGNTHTTSKTVVQSRPTEENDIKPKDDRWVWGEVEDKITTEKDSTGEKTTVPDLEDRVNFTGDKCPTGKVKIKGICVYPD